jgi:hypothetical protein
MSWVREGYTLPFCAEPQPFWRRPIAVAPTDAEWLESEIQRNLEVGAWVETDQPGDYMSAAFIVQSSSGKRRVVVDLRPLNAFLKTDTVRFETLSSFRDLFRPGDWAISLDLQSAYHHVGVHVEHQEFLGFSLAGRHFQCAALPFGLSTAPAVFTKFVRPLVRLWRGRGWRVLPYLDDFLFLFASQQEAAAARPQIDQDLSSLGLQRSVGKGVWEPSQLLTHLGVVLDLHSQTFKTDPNRLRRLEEMALVIARSPARHQRWCDRRLLKVFCGLAVSVLLSAPTIRLFLRRLYDATATGRGSRTKLNRAALRDAQSLMDVLRSSQSLGAPISLPGQPTVLLDTDASTEVGWGAALRRPGDPRDQPRYRASGGWPPGSTPIYVLELRATLLGLQSFAHLLRGETVQLDTDNQSAAWSLRGWTSRSPAARRVLFQIWEILDRLHCRLLVRWIPSAENAEADRLSRRVDRHDWRLRTDLVCFAVERWGPPTIDRFASAHTALVPRFNSWTHQPGAEAVDGLAQPWQGERNWVNPPWPLITRALLKLQAEPEAEAIVIAPHWPSAPWWPLLLEMTADLVEWVPPQARSRSRHPNWHLALAFVPRRDG